MNDQSAAIDYLFQLTIQKKWGDLVELYNTHSWVHKAKLTKSEETALHVAISCYESGPKGTNAIYIKRMIDCIPEEQVFCILSMQNDKGNTPLHLAATVGSAAICKYIAFQDHNLIRIRNSKGETPLFRAARHGNTNAFLFLFDLYHENQGQEPLESLCRRSHDGNTILHTAISGAYFDLAHQIICRFPNLVNSVNVDGESPLHVLAKKPEMVEKILSICPVAIQDLNSNGKNVWMLAAENRQIRVLEYLLSLKLPEYMFNQVDDKGNTVLHLAAMLTQPQPWRTPGVALQMQLELKWYKFVKYSVPSLRLARHNKNGETPKQIFTSTHEILVKDGTRWLTKTSESCSLIAALIATVAFATSSTVPGGVDDATGHPILRDHTAFYIFSITSVLALCLSVTALVFFLSIMTSRCQQRDFKNNLPWKLLMGLTTLFASLAAMAVSFFAGHAFILKKNLWIVAFPLYFVACAPLTIFVIAKLPLYFDLLWASCNTVPLHRTNTVPSVSRNPDLHPNMGLAYLGPGPSGEPLDEPVIQRPP